MRNRILDNKGSALLSVMIMTAILTVFGLLLLNVSLAETKYAVYIENNSQAHYIARAGADATAAYIIENSDELNNLIADTTGDTGTPGTGTIGGGNFSVTVSSLTNGQVLIYSEGHYENSPVASVSLKLNRSFGGFDHAIFSDGALDFSNNASVYGSAGTNSSTGINIGNGATISDDMFFGPGTDLSDYNNFINKVQGGIYVLDEELPFPEIDESDFPARSIPDRIQLPNPPARVLSDGFYTDIDKSVIFDTGSGSKLMVRVDDLELKGNSIMTVTGDAGNSGELHLLVTGSISLGGTSRIVSTNGAKVFVYYSGISTVDIRGTMDMFGILYAPEAHVDWRGGGNGDIIGSIIAKQVSLGSSHVNVTYNGGFDYMGLAIDNIAIYRRYEYGQ